MPSPEVLERYIATVESNAYVEAIEAFYAPEATMQENDAPPRAGREHLVAHEAKVLARARSVSSRCIRPAFIDGEHAVIRWVFEFEWKDGTRMRMEELTWQRWEGGRIVEEKFFYDPRQLQPVPKSS